MKYFDFMTFVLDVETSGLDPNRHALLSVGGVLLNEELVEVQAIELFLKQNEYLVQPEAMAVNKIDLAEHNKKATISRSDLRFELEEFFRYRSTPIVLAGWNVGFDLSWLYQSWDARYFWPFVSRDGGGEKGTRTIDIQTLAVAVERKIKPKLSEQLEHTALADARLEANKLRELMQQIAGL